jgi:hypothetical protein
VSFDNCPGLQPRDAREQLANRLLARINDPANAERVIGDVVRLVKEASGLEAVGIRLRDGDDYPYVETSGFPDHFVELERSLCVRDKEGAVACDERGRPRLECMCGNILRGRIDPAVPFFTRGGSFWSNCTTELLASTTDEERQAATRNRCNGMGYESVALIPLRARTEIIGLLQLNDKRRDRFTIEMIEWFEGLGTLLGIALGRRLAEDALAKERRRSVELAALVEGCKRVLKGGDYPLVARALFDVVRDVTGATAGYVALLNEKGGPLPRSGGDAVHGGSEPSDAHSWPARRGVPERSGGGRERLHAQPLDEPHARGARRAPQRRLCPAEPRRQDSRRHGARQQAHRLFGRRCPRRRGIR